VGPRACVAVLQAVAPGSKSLCRLKIHAHLQGLGHLQKLAQLTAQHLHHPNNPRSDLSYSHPARVACGEVNLDGLGAEHWIEKSWSFYSATFSLIRINSLHNRLNDRLPIHASSRLNVAEKAG
jgi:hypothetical protein